MSNIRTVVCNADAVLFPASGRKDKVVITLSSSEGGLEHAEKLARYLLEHGHPENPIMVLQRGNGSREKTVWYILLELSGTGAAIYTV